MTLEELPYSEWDGDEYDRRLAEIRPTGPDVHGEANLVESLRPATVLDAGCGTGRVAIELARRGMSVVGVDIDPRMLDTARRKAPELRWVEGDISAVRLTDVDGAPLRVDVVLLAGNVMIFVAPGSEGAVVENLARQLVPGGAMVAGFQLLPGRVDLATYDRVAAGAGLRLENRWATWEREPYAGGDYAVSVHRRVR